MLRTENVKFRKPWMEKQYPLLSTPNKIEHSGGPTAMKHNLPTPSSLTCDPLSGILPPWPVTGLPALRRAGHVQLPPREDMSGKSSQRAAVAADWARVCLSGWFGLLGGLALFGFSEKCLEL